MIETERLILKPLHHDQLLKYIKDDHSLEEEFGLLYTRKNISPELQEALQQSTLPEVVDQDRNYCYKTLWMVISKKENRIVGDISFIGEPDQRGEVEIGYGTYETFRGKGYMTEAIRRIVEWAKEQPEVQAIFASTTKENIASYSILEKNNFVHVGEVDEMLSWRLQVK
ncbi:GNAT family N-acetyltransferase [Pedobacter petrophilus]|uniref:GNAT family N-acetyltransferase n=1 Tax=Pedobacter petrophilus TaxID=1908241 RepID=A0A7K0G4H1_9SPHI|nr:GNAT family N-acetyltransferase [Pedobacter petrophilus]MRX78708.1 GNAT family N-acetyltransferase [Pedobacter petrophilus]